MTQAEAIELAALERLNTEAETVSEFIARMTPKYAPLPEHLQRVADVLDAAREDEICATISIPVRMGKTETLAHGLAHRNVYDPGVLNFYATFGDGLAKQTSRKVRKLARAAGVPMSREAQEVHDWRTVYDGGLKATSVGGDVTGRGCKGGLVVADDLLKGRKQAESKAIRDTTWEYLKDDLMSRLEPGSSFVVNAARWHQDDIIGRLHEDPLGREWIHIDLAAVIGADGLATDERDDPAARSIWPKVWDLARLAKIRMRGEYGWWSLYQQKPAPRGGGMFKRDNFGYFDERPRGGRWVRRWDLAASTDRDAAWTAGVLVGLVDGKLFVVDVQHGQWGPHDRDQKILATAKADGRSVEVWLPQDPGQAGLSQRPHYGSLLQGYTVHFERESAKKEIRWDPYASQVEAKNVHLARGASWVRRFLEEHEMAPTGKLKDQIDAMAGAYYALIVWPPQTPSHGGFYDDGTGTSAPTTSTDDVSPPNDWCA
jgi:predicted phage terminase large subunit-like protein